MAFQRKDCYTGLFDLSGYFNHLTPSSLLLFSPVSGDVVTTPSLLAAQKFMQGYI